MQRRRGGGRRAGIMAAMSIASSEASWRRQQRAISMVGQRASRTRTHGSRDKESAPGRGDSLSGRRRACHLT
jgi:hypothetical protein